MKSKILTIVILINGLFVFGQNSAFRIYENGLIYSDTTMEQLSKIVDSLNLDFLSCKLSKTYYSKQQAKGHFIKLSKEDVESAKEDIENNISYADFIKKYSTTEIDDYLLIVKFKYRDYNGNEIVEFSNIELGNDKRHVLSFKDQDTLYTKKLCNSWVFDYCDRGKYIDESISAFFFIEEFTSIPIPEKYARMVQYSDCLIDTTTQVFFENAYRSGIRIRTNESVSIKKFMKFIHRKTKKPVYEDFKDRNNYWSEYIKWDSLKFDLIDKKLANTKKFKKLLIEAVDEGIAKGGSNDEFEEIVGMYISKEIELFLRRNRIVEGGCGFDNSPRYHALKIAILSAETLNWKVFLRSHLDIMNNRFDIVSDGSYAWDGRQTFIKELEDLEINIPDLFLGILLRIENPSQNHYYDNFARLGRAIAESKYKDDFEKEILNGIKNKSLDDYNRILLYYLFLNYNKCLKDEERKEKNFTLFQNAVNELPDYLLIRIKSENYQFEKLLKEEIEIINQHFKISRPGFGTLGSIDWDMIENGNCWYANFKDIKEVNNIMFDVTMEYDIKPGSIKPLLEQKDSLRRRVYEANFIINYLKEKSTSKLEIHFTINKSFSDHAQQSFLSNLPDNLKQKYSLSLNSAILMTLSNENGWSRWLIFSNGDIMLWHFSGSSPIEKYSIEQLKISGGSFNNSFKVFNINGIIKE